MAEYGTRGGDNGRHAPLGSARGSFPKKPQEVASSPTVLDASRKLIEHAIKAYTKQALRPYSRNEGAGRLASQHFVQKFSKEGGSPDLLYHDLAREAFNAVCAAYGLRPSSTEALLAAFRQEPVTDEEKALRQKIAFALVVVGFDLAMAALSRFEGSEKHERALRPSDIRHHVAIEIMRKVWETFTGNQLSCEAAEPFLPLLEGISPVKWTGAPAPEKPRAQLGDGTRAFLEGLLSDAAFLKFLTLQILRVTPTEISYATSPLKDDLRKFVETQLREEGAALLGRLDSFIDDVRDTKGGSESRFGAYYLHFDEQLPSLLGRAQEARNRIAEACGKPQRLFGPFPKVPDACRARCIARLRRQLDELQPKHEKTLKRHAEVLECASRCEREGKPFTEALKFNLEKSAENAAAAQREVDAILEHIRLIEEGVYTRRR